MSTELEFLRACMEQGTFYPAGVDGTIGQSADAIRLVMDTSDIESKIRERIRELETNV